MLSIIIPTLNEEKNLERLLSSIREENLDNIEIIVADAGSKDKTIEVAHKYRAVVTSGGLPARGRNEGVKKATKETILFLDADLVLSKDFIRNSINKFEKKRLAVASFPIFPIKNNLILNRVTVNLIYNFPQMIFTKIFPMGAMAIMVKKDIFEKVGGFDEGIKLAEDHYFVQQAAKLGKFGVINSAKIFMPVRRFERDGYFRTGFKYLLCALHMIFLGPVRSNALDYKFDHYDKDKE